MSEESENERDGQSVDPKNDPATRASKRKPTKALPNNRLVFSKHLDILRGYVAASGLDKKPVSNDDVAKVVNIHAGSISNCNPFFNNIGLIRRDKNGYIPSDDVIAYAERYKWDSDKSALKLEPIIRNSWFAAALLPKLSFRPLSRDEAIGFLAEESNAAPEYKQNLELLIDYLRVAGLVSVDGDTLSLSDVTKVTPDTSSQNSGVTPPAQQPVTTTQQNTTLIDSRLRDIHPSIVGVLLKLPSPEGAWTMKDKKRFMSALGAVLNLVYDLEEEDGL